MRNCWKKTLAVLNAAMLVMLVITIVACGDNNGPKFESPTATSDVPAAVTTPVATTPTSSVTPSEACPSGLFTKTAGGVTVCTRKSGFNEAGLCTDLTERLKSSSVTLIRESGVVNGSKGQFGSRAVLYHNSKAGCIATEGPEQTHPKVTGFPVIAGANAIVQHEMTVEAGACGRYQFDDCASNGEICISIMEHVINTGKDCPEPTPPPQTCPIMEPVVVTDSVSTNATDATVKYVFAGFTGTYQFQVNGKTYDVTTSSVVTTTVALGSSALTWKIVPPPLPNGQQCPGKSGTTPIPPKPGEMSCSVVKPSGYIGDSFTATLVDTIDDAPYSAVVTRGNPASGNGKVVTSTATAEPSIVFDYTSKSGRKASCQATVTKKPITCAEYHFAWVPKSDINATPNNDDRTANAKIGLDWATGSGIPDRATIRFNPTNIYGVREGSRKELISWDFTRMPQAYDVNVDAVVGECTAPPATIHVPALVPKPASCSAYSLDVPAAVDNSDGTTVKLRAKANWTLVNTTGNQGLDSTINFGGPKSSDRPYRKGDGYFVWESWPKPKVGSPSEFVKISGWVNDFPEACKDHETVEVKPMEEICKLDHSAAMYLTEGDFSPADYSPTASNTGDVHKMCRGWVTISSQCSTASKTVWVIKNTQGSEQEVKVTDANGQVVSLSGNSGGLPNPFKLAARATIKVYGPKVHLKVYLKIGKNWELSDEADPS